MDTAVINVKLTEILVLDIDASEKGFVHCQHFDQNTMPNLDKHDCHAGEPCYPEAEAGELDLSAVHAVERSRTSPMMAKLKVFVERKGEALLKRIL